LEPFLPQMQGNRAMARGYSNDLRERVIRAVESGCSRRAAAKQFAVSASTAIKWVQRFQATGSYVEKSGRGHSRSPLDVHAEWLLSLVADQPHLTLEEIRARLREERLIGVGIGSVWRFFHRHGVSFNRSRLAKSERRSRRKQPTIHRPQSPTLSALEQGLIAPVQQAE
jgi:transposase